MKLGPHGYHPDLDAEWLHERIVGSLDRFLRYMGHSDQAERLHNEEQGLDCNIKGIISYFKAAKPPTE